MVEKSISEPSETDPIYVMLFKNEDKHYVRIDSDGNIVASPSLVQITKPLMDEYRSKLAYKVGTASMMMFEIGLQPKVCKTTLKELKRKIHLPAQGVKFTETNVYGIPCDCESIYNNKKCFSVAKKLLRVKQ